MSTIRTGAEVVDSLDETVIGRGRRRAARTNGGRREKAPDPPEQPTPVEGRGLGAGVPVTDGDPDLAGTGPLAGGDAEYMATVLKAIAHPKRLQLISIVQADERGEACVTELTGPLGLSQPAVSHHLKTLSEAGLMRRVRRGNWACYSLVPAVLEPVLEALKLLL